eukprot:TRINITY_DN284_c0_g1_i1.p1 TRINITY_DN284_c0_g1~~TRINITY_DN284_c0_g1_i1.p1  ORF type:complete len:199 (-),score=67.34 TRINITY_DN284_c0_g1_i1:194-706(-)
MLAATRRVISSTPIITSSISRNVIRSRGYADVATDRSLVASLVCPHSPIFIERKVDLLTVPGSAGVFGIAKDHVPTIAELQPGLVVVDEGGKKEKFFVSGGFAIVNTDKTCVVRAVEAVPLDQLDVDAAKRGVQKYTQELATSNDNEAKAKAQIGLDVHRAMCIALGVSA